MTFDLLSITDVFESMSWDLLKFGKSYFISFFIEKITFDQNVSVFMIFNLFNFPYTFRYFT